ncbi:hypothetical protein LINPERHAP2_LOCUS12249 [Linum perenne]
MGFSGGALRASGSDASTVPLIFFMVADSGSTSPKAWTDLFDSDSDLSLRYIKPVLVNGALRIPQSVLNQGLARMKRCLLGQFLGPSPPIKVFQSVATRLWGRDGGVRISLQQNGLFLIQFPSAEDSSWVLSKGPWHIHNTLLHLRPWKSDLKPLVVEDSVSPLWVKMNGIPPALSSKDGACVLISKGAERPLVLNVVPDGFDPITIDLEYLPPRDYSRKTSAVIPKSKWKQKGVIGSSVDPPRTVEPIQVSATIEQPSGSAVVEPIQVSASKKQPSSSVVVSEEPLQLPISEESAANKVIPESPTKRSSAGSSPSKGTTGVADPRCSQVGGIALTGSQFGALALDDPELRNVKIALKTLNKEAYSNIRARVSLLASELDKAHIAVMDNPSVDNMEVVAALTDCWNTARTAEESFLKQKARENWVNLGGLKY